MSKTSETKDKILELLEDGDKRLIDIYPKLGLSAATVSQHLKELKEMNIIKETDNSHFKNMKYYTLSNKTSNSDEINNEKLLKPQMLRISISVIVIAAVLAALLLYYPSGASTTQYPKSNNLSILLTDPPHVPLGTQSLNITYSSLEVRASTANSSSWIPVNANGTLDLMSLVNLSTLMASVPIPVNTIIDMAAFNITKATIEINNESYPVDVPENRIIANVSMSGRFNGSSGLLFDLSPTIITLYMANATLFEMVPSVKAIMVGKQQLGLPSSSKSGSMTHHPIPLNRSVLENLSILKGSIEIIGGTINSTGNITKIEIMVKDTSNKSVMLGHVLIFGNESLYFNSNSIKRNHLHPDLILPIQAARISVSRGINHMHNINASANHGRMGFNMTSRFNATNVGDWSDMYNWSTGEANSPFDPNGIPSMSVGGMPGKWMSVSGFFNIPLNIGKNVSPSNMSTGMRNAFVIGSYKERLGVINFIVDDDGTLSQPMYTGHASSPQQGFILNPGQVTTLGFNGTVSLGAGFITTEFKYGSVYTIDVIGVGGAYASYNIIAS
jgi:DNA-binding transcriptional ArsR family regulator